MALLLLDSCSLLDQTQISLLRTLLITCRQLIVFLQITHQRSASMINFFSFLQVPSHRGRTPTVLSWLLKGWGFQNFSLGVAVLCLFAWGTQSDPQVFAASEHSKRCRAVAFKSQLWLSGGPGETWRKCFKRHRLFVLGTSLVVQWLRLHLPMQGVWVWSLVGELRSHMPHGRETKT